MFSPLRLAASFAALALAPFATAASPESFLPADTYAVAKVENLPATRARWEAHPLPAAWRATGYPAIVAPLLERLTADPAVRTRLDRFAAIAKALDGRLRGEALLAIVPDRSPAARGDAARAFLAATDADDALMKNLIAAIPRPADAGAPDEPEVAEHRGVRLHAFDFGYDLPPAYWCVLDGHFLVCSAEAPLRAMIDTAKDTLPNAFSESPVYLANREATKVADAWILVNMPAVATALRHDVRRAFTLGDGTVRLGPLGMDVFRGYDALGLDAMTHVRARLMLHAEDTHLSCAVGWKEDRGLVKLFSGHPGTVPDYSGLPADLMAVTAGRHDFRAAFAEAETLLREALPAAAPMLDLQLDGLRDEHGLDVRGALIDNLTGDFWAATAAPRRAAAGKGMSTPSVFVMSVRDTAAANRFVEAFAKRIATAAYDIRDDEDHVERTPAELFTESRVSGVTVREFKVPPADTGPVSYAIHDGKLFVAIGHDAPMAKIVTGFVTRDGGLAKDPAVIKALAGLPKAPFAVRRYDLGKYLRYGMRSAVAAYNASAAGTVVKLDPDRLPDDTALPFTVVSTSHLVGNETTTHIVLLKNAEKPVAEGPGGR